MQAKMRHRGLRWLLRHGHLDDVAVHTLDMDQEAPSVFLCPETHYVGDLRFTLPIRLVERGEMRCALLGPGDEAIIELPQDAQIEMTICAKELEYQGVDVKEIQSEFELCFVQADGTRVTQQPKTGPKRLTEKNGYKCKDMLVDFFRRKRTKHGQRSRTCVQFELRELRSEEFEGRLGGPSAFAG